jgi:NAD(P)-dependent dehydrogenase (short-subunit alcohol dehydrogenase family)
MNKLEGAVVVVTGAGSGIGRALAQELALHSTQLALADVNSAGLEQTRQLLGSAPARTYVTDVSEASEVENFVRQVEKDFGRVSLLINNAGVALYGTFKELTITEFDWLFRINFWGVVHGCKFFLPLLEREPEAHIVNISSVFGLIAPAGQTAYSASKFAVRGFTQALRQELIDTNITVTCVHPGGIRTNIAENARAGVATRPEDQAEARERFNKVVRTSPEKAARVIVNGIMRNQARVLIGADAYQIDLIQRLMPVRSGSWLAGMIERRTPKLVTSKAATAKE